MSFRCVKPFSFNGHVYAGGRLVDDGDPILQTHQRHFAKIAESRAAVETASAAPAETRTVTEPERAPEPEKPAPKPQRRAPKGSDHA